jgi:5-methylcytosine-specific restriction endonuclease McrA
MKRATRDLVLRRAKSSCEYCRMPQAYDPLEFEIDHIIAQKHHGRTSVANLALACFHCNNHKGANIAGIDSRTRQTVPLFHPRRQQWKEHFKWRGAFLLGLTPCGRATSTFPTESLTVEH